MTATCLPYLSMGGRLYTPTCPLCSENGLMTMRRMALGNAQFGISIDKHQCTEYFLCKETAIKGTAQQLLDRAEHSALQGAFTGARNANR